MRGAASAILQPSEVQNRMKKREQAMDVSDAELRRLVRRWEVDRQRHERRFPPNPPNARCRHAVLVGVLCDNGRGRSFDRRVLRTLKDSVVTGRASLFVSGSTM